jgi:hypothetical protein
MLAVISIMKFLQENISWIKDVFTLIVVGTGTVIAILTYIRARATILQPIRTEVIKKQSELLSKLLQSLRETDFSFEKGLDYVNLVQINVLMTLKDYGFVFKEHEELFKKIQGDLAGWIPCGNSNVIKDIEVIGTFENASIDKPANVGAERFENLKQGKAEIEKIYLSKKHSQFVKTINDFRDDPFMPVTIQKALTEVLNDINNNLAIILKGELESFMLSFSKDYFDKKEAPKFNPVGIYNEFNHTRVHHRTTLTSLKNEIRKYLRIDESW